MDNTNANIDLIRSHVDIIILKPLESQDRYGYEILREIETNSNGLFNLKQPTMYSCLKRLEKQGYIRSYLGDESNGAQRRYYALTGQGRDFLESQQNQWEFVRTILSGLVSSEDFDKDKDVKPFDPSKYRPLTKRTRSDDDEENVKVIEKIVYVPIDKSDETNRNVESDSVNDFNKDVDVEKYIENIASDEIDTNIVTITDYLNEVNADETISNVSNRGDENASIEIEEDMSVSPDSLSFTNGDNTVIERTFISITQQIAENQTTENNFDPEYIDDSYGLTESNEVIEDNIDFIEEFNAESTDDVFDKIESIEESVNDDFKEEFSEAYYEEELTAIDAETFDNYEDTTCFTDKKAVNREKAVNSDATNVINFNAGDEADEKNNNESENYDVTEESMFHDNSTSNEIQSKREEWLEHYNYENIKYSTYEETTDNELDVTPIDNDSYNDKVTYVTSSDVKLDDDIDNYESEINLFSVLDNIYTEKDGAGAETYDEESLKPRSVDYSSTADNENLRPMLTINDLKIKLKNEGFNVKPYTKINSSEYYINNYYYCNRTGRDASYITYLLLFFESLIAHFALAKTYALPLWYLPIVWVSLAVIPTIATVIWSISPYHKKRTRVSLRLSLLIGLIALLNIALVILLIGFFGFGADYRDIKTMMLPIIVPMIFLLNIPLYSLIYYLLYKTKRYNLR